MKTSLYHIQLNVSDVKLAIPFYKDLLGYFEYEIIDESPEHLGISNGTTDFWIMQTENKYKTNTFHRKSTGVNHLAFRVERRKEVDKFYNDFLKKRNIATLYNTPKLFAEYKDGYYAVFFEGPDRIKLEVVYLP